MDDDTDPRCDAQPMDAARLSDLRDHTTAMRTASWISDADGRDLLAELLADRDHWRLCYQQGLDANMDLVREVKRLNGLLDESVVDSVSRSGKVTFCRRRDKRGAADS